MTGQLRDLTLNRDGTYNLTLTLACDVQPLYDQLQGAPVDVELKKHRKARSLNANAYAWVLMDKIAEVMQVDKLDYYRAAVRSIGGVSDVVCVPAKAVDGLRRGWEAHGLGWQTELMDRESKVQGAVNVVLYYGSSLYDSRQMATLIDHLIQDAEALGIPTLTDAETQRMLGAWAAKQKEVTPRDEKPAAVG